MQLLVRATLLQRETETEAVVDVVAWQLFHVCAGLPGSPHVTVAGPVSALDCVPVDENSLTEKDCGKQSCGDDDDDDGCGCGCGYLCAPP